MVNFTSKGRRSKKAFSRPKRQKTSYIFSDDNRRKLEKYSDLKRFVEELTPLRKCKNGDYAGTCLICQPKLGPSSRKKNHFRIRKGNKFFKCFRCGCGGKLTGFVKQYYNVPYDTAFWIIYKNIPKNKKFEVVSTFKKREFIDDGLPF